MTATIKNMLFLLMLLLSNMAAAFTYDSKNLERDLNSAQEVVVALKVAGLVSPQSFQSYRSTFYPIGGEAALEAALEAAWERLQEHNRNSSPSTFMVLGSLGGKLKIGEVFYIEDSWIPIELGSVAVHFMNPQDFKKKLYDLNPCHRFDSVAIRKAVASFNGERGEVIHAALASRAWYCVEQPGI